MSTPASSATSSAPAWQSLQARQLATLAQIKQLEARLARLEPSYEKDGKKQKKSDDEKNGDAGKEPVVSKKPVAAAASSSSSSSSSSAANYELPSDDDPSRWWDVSTYTPDTSGVVPRLSSLCSAAGLTHSRFYRVSSDYYSWTLEQRRDCLNAPSIVHLCKSVIMENTHLKEPITKANPKYICVIVSYTEKLKKEKLENATYAYYKANTSEPMSKRAYDASWRLAADAEAIQLTGYQHNGMTPVGMTTEDLLIVLSATVLKLETGSFFLGGGEVDVKWRISVKQFAHHFKPIIADICTA